MKYKIFIIGLLCYGVFFVVNKQALAAQHFGCCFVDTMFSSQSKGAYDMPEDLSVGSTVATLTGAVCVSAKNTCENCIGLNGGTFFDYNYYANKQTGTCEYVAGKTGNQGCCKRITWPYGGKIGNTYYTTALWDTDDRDQCFETCKGFSSSFPDCQNVFRPKDKVAGNQCQGDVNCCQLEIEYTHSIYGKQSIYLAYAANDQWECNIYCGMPINADKCKGYIVQNALPNISTGRCVTQPSGQSGPGYQGGNKAAAQALQNQPFDLPPNPFKDYGEDPAAATAGIIGNVIKVFLMVLGSIALAMFIYGGFSWMTAFGQEAKVKTARQTLIWATAGMIVIFLAYIAVGFLLDTALFR